MKKFLLLFLLCFAIVHFTQAQVIELLGEGVKDQADPVLIIPNPGTVDYVVVEAAGIFRFGVPGYMDPLPANVNFSDNDESYSATFIEASPRDPDLSGSQSWGYYTATFNTVDAGGITLLNTGQEEYIVSFIAYVYRTDGSGFYSETKGDHAFLFRNGSANKLTYTFTGIPTSSAPRSIDISIPFSEVNQDGRWSVIEVTPNDGSGTSTIDFDDNNRGQRLHIEEISIPDASGSITEVEVSVYSPTLTEYPPSGGDSFILSPMLLTTTKDEEGRGCTLTWGYWKTHSELGPAAHPDATWDLVGGPNADFFAKSGQTYIQVLNTAVKGNAYYILAHQYIAAKLNMLAGADMSAVLSAFNAATILLQNNAPADIDKLKGNDPLRKQFVDLGETLDDFNMGKIGPGHCDEMEDSEKSAVLDNSIEISEFSVFPNPVNGNATLSFNPAFNGNATVDIYNSMGQKTFTLFNQNVRKDVPVQFMFDGNQFSKGLYIITLQNGHGRESLKVQFGR